jgi:hypothetical protein
MCYSTKFGQVSTVRTGICLRPYVKQFSVRRLTFTKLMFTPYILWTSLKSKVLPLQAWAGPWGSGSLRLPDFLDFRHYKGGAPAVFTPRRFLVLIFRSWVDSRAHGSVCSYGKKSPATPLGIDPETFRLVAQCLNHYATSGPVAISYKKFYRNLKIRAESHLRP